MRQRRECSLLLCIICSDTELKIGANKDMAKRVARMGILTALAMVFSYVEVLIPFSFGIPGVKLGVANLVVLTGLYLLKPQEVFLISLVRILLMGVLFGNAASLIYSLAGGIFSFCVMLICKKTSWFSMTGVSVAGGVSHNLGQLLAAMVVLGSKKIGYYFHVLILAGIVTGVLIGIVSDRIAKILGKQELNGIF